MTARSTHYRVKLFNNTDDPIFSKQGGIDQVADWADEIAKNNPKMLVAIQRKTSSKWIDWSILK